MSQASTLHLNIPFHQIFEYIYKDQQPEVLQTLKVVPLTGGYVASSVYRLDLEFGSAVHSFVQKYADGSEIRVMKRLQDDLALAEIPPIVSASVSPEASWFVMPFYEGDILDFDDDLPLSIIQALATVHAYYGTRAEEIDWLPQVNGDYIDGLLQYTTACLNDNRERFPTSIYADVYNQLQAADIAPTLDKTFQRLPKTLTHGDVHSGNVIQTTTGNHILFDWGNARVAPGMLDIANMVEMGSESWDAYVGALEAASGKTVDLDIAYVWATIVVNLQYLPFAISHLDPDTAQAMVNKLRQALTALQKQI